MLKDDGTLIDYYEKNCLYKEKCEFPYDKIEPVKKGKRGGDLIQTVIDKQNNQTGKILHERK